MDEKHQIKEKPTEILINEQGKAKYAEKIYSDLQRIYYNAEQAIIEEKKKCSEELPKSQEELVKAYLGEKKNQEKLEAQIKTLREKDEKLKKIYQKLESQKKLETKNSIPEGAIGSLAECNSMIKANEDVLRSVLEERQRVCERVQRLDNISQMQYVMAQTIKTMHNEPIEFLEINIAEKEEFGERNLDNAAFYESIQRDFISKMIQAIPAPECGLFSYLLQNANKMYDAVLSGKEEELKNSEKFLNKEEGIRAVERVIDKVMRDNQAFPRYPENLKPAKAKEQLSSTPKESKEDAKNMKKIFVLSTTFVIILQAVCITGYKIFSYGQVSV